MYESPYKRKQYLRGKVSELSFVNLISRPSKLSFCPRVIAYGESLMEPGGEIVSRKAQPCWTLELVTAGTGKFFCREKSYSIRPGDLLIHSSDERVVNTGKTSFSKNYVSLISTDEFKKRFLPFPEDGNILRFRNSERIFELFSRIKKLIMESPPFLDEELAGVLYQCYIEMEKHDSPALKYSHPNEKSANLSYLPQYFSSVKALMNELNLSRPALYQYFRKTYQTTPMEYIIGKRLENAVWHIENNNISLSETALLCGYKNLQFFSRAFKSRYGVSPRAYRKMISDGTIPPKTR